MHTRASNTGKAQKVINHKSCTSTASVFEGLFRTTLAAPPLISPTAQRRLFREAKTDARVHNIIPSQYHSPLRLPNVQQNSI